MQSFLLRSSQWWGSPPIGEEGGAGFKTLMRGWGLKCNSCISACHRQKTFLNPLENQLNLLFAFLIFNDHFYKL